MKKLAKQITVPSPCSQDWFDMDDSGEQPARFCNQCQEHVHDISSMTRREALAFMEKHRWQVCVNYEVGEDGEILYAPEPPSRWARQLDGALRLAAAAALVVPLLSACEESPEQIQPTASTPIEISADGARINARPGAGRSPSFSHGEKKGGAEPEHVEVARGEEDEPACDGIEEPGDQQEVLEKEKREEDAKPPKAEPRPHHRRLGGKPIMNHIVIERSDGSDSKDPAPVF